MAIKTFSFANFRFIRNKKKSIFLLLKEDSLLLYMNAHVYFGQYSQYLIIRLVYLLAMYEDYNLLLATRSPTHWICPSINIGPQAIAIGRFLSLRV